MAVYRVQRTRDYTVMSNYHLRDKNLTLKSKGLLSMILSLPDEWNYTTRGLAAICKEGVDAIGSALKELETAGYIVRRQLRGANGHIVVGVVVGVFVGRGLAAAGAVGVDVLQVPGHLTHPAPADVVHGGDDGVVGGVGLGSRGQQKGPPRPL